jgi:hypothetical protein
MDTNKEYVLEGAQPTYFEVRRGRDSVENAVYAEFMEHLKQHLSKMLVAEEFSAAQVPNEFSQEVRNFAPRAGRKILDYESMRLDVIPDQPLHSELARLIHPMSIWLLILIL